MKIKILKLKLKVSLKSLIWFFKSYKRILYALIIAVIFLQILYFSFNWSLLNVVITSPNLSPLEKFNFLISTFNSVLQSNGLFQFILIIFVSLIQGLSILTIIYIIKNQKNNIKYTSNNIFISFLVLIGLGCPSCGTSILSPILSIFISGSTVGLSETITSFVLPVAFLMGIYGLYILGLRLSSIQAQSKIDGIQ